MKNLKTTFILITYALFLTSLSYGQQTYFINQDNVKPSKATEYEKVVKEFQAASVENNVQTSWMSAMRNDFTYYYIVPIENMAEMDKRPFSDMKEAMGDKWEDMFNRMDKSCSSYGSYFMHSVDELSYKAPEGTDMSDLNYRKWFLMYYTPKNADKVKEGMKAVRDMFESKGSKEYYNVYQSGIGNMESHYLVSVPAIDELDSAKRAKENQEVLGPDRYETFNKVLNYISRMEEYSGMMRPDLSYAPKKVE
ncbi:hypothetical protein [Seonamhaeicola marinus]|uniref:Uncharacterized protein n=1 Tax=Seonamhaeicola marinus TaxID=1912246 RepID=A0A5D0HNN1_9FLAO|nr:hypothetical protein [Seonamhaeicola marinus]TYA71999.1 hypothetical protein FUA24_20860 [Seonamhaeicola marinus]